MPKPVTVRMTKTVEQSERDGNTRPPDLPLEKSVCRSGSNSYNWTWNNRLVSNRKSSLMDSMGEGEGGKIWENGIETCKYHV